MSQVAKNNHANLVPGRECGACSACCTNLRIDAKKLQKPANVACPNLTPAQGCAIYGSRPSACRSFHCGWRMLGGLDDAWRPDRSKVMIRVERDGLVMEGLGSMQAVLAPPVLKFIGTCIENEVTIYLSIPEAPGHGASKLPLNVALAFADTARKRGAAMRELVKAIEYGESPTPTA